MPIGEVTIRGTPEDVTDILHEVFPQLPTRDDAAVWHSFATMSEYCQTLPDHSGIEAYKEGAGEHGTVRIQNSANVLFFRGYSEEVRAGTPGFILYFSSDEGAQLLAEKLVQIAESRELVVRAYRSDAASGPTKADAIRALFAKHPEMRPVDIAKQVGCSTGNVQHALRAMRPRRKTAHRAMPVKIPEQRVEDEPAAKIVEQPVESPKQLDQLIADMEKQLAALKAIRDLKGDPALFQQMVRLFKDAPKAKTGRAEKCAGVIAEFLRERNNAPTTYMQIVKATGYNHVYVQIVIKKHLDTLFEKVNPGEKPTLIRLKTA